MGWSNLSASRCGAIAPRRKCVTAVVGEIQVRSYGVMRAYFDDPAATAAALDGDGWLRTGDLGSMAVRPLRHNLMFNKDELKGGLR
jgi:long-subunit acyl-CoA synthetase (AMP-forming)